MKFYHKIIKWIRSNAIKNKSVTVISNNCWGGFMYQSCNLPYNSPLIGLYFYAPEYIKFLENLKQPMTKKLTQELLKKGHIHSKKLYSKRTGKMFEADLVLSKTIDKEGNPASSIQLDFGRSVRK